MKLLLAFFCTLVLPQFVGATELVVNGSFEDETSTTQNNGNWGYYSACTYSGWTFSNGSGGFSKVNTPWIANQTLPDSGKWVTFLQSSKSGNGGAISQDVTIPAIAFYELSFYACGRKETQYHGQQLTVSLDSLVVTNIVVSGSTLKKYTCQFISNKAGTCQLKFQAESTSDKGSSIDCISLKKIDIPNELADSLRYNLESGELECSIKSIVNPTKGTLRVNGNDLEYGASVWIAASDSLTVQFIAKEGEVFNTWMTDLPLSQLTEETILLENAKPLVIDVVVASDAQTLTYTGANNGDWNDVYNWTPQTLPMADSHVIVDGISVKCSDSINIKKLTIKNATLAVAGAENKHISVNIADDLIIGENGVLSVTAGRCQNPTNNTTAYHHPTIFAEANPVTVGGTMRICDRGRFVPVSDLITGVPIILYVKDLIIDRDGRIDSEISGYGWAAKPATGTPLGAKTDNDAYTYAPATGITYNNGGKYTYGYMYAPWMSGSPNGVYNKISSGYGTGSMGWVRGGGSSCVFASGTIKIAGDVRADGGSRLYGSSSGGGIWLNATNYCILSTARLRADGGDCLNYGQTAHAGTGGRISMGFGLDCDHIQNLSTGMLPAKVSLAYADSLTGIVSASARGGRTCPFTISALAGEVARSRRSAGTVTYTHNTNVCSIVRVEVIGADGKMAYGGTIVGANTEFATHIESLKPDEELKSHYVAESWSVTNAQGTVVASGIDDNATFSAGTNAIVYLTWRVKQIEDEVAVIAPSAVTINGESVEPGSSVRIIRGSDAAFGGAGVTGWTFDGEKIPATTVAVERKITGPMKVTAVSTIAVDKEYTGSLDGGLWENPTNWTPAGIPSITDNVRINAGFVYSTGIVSAASLTVAEGAVLAIGGKANTVLSQTPQSGTKFGIDVAGDVKILGDVSIGGTDSEVPVAVAIAGDLILEGSARLAVYARKPKWNGQREYPIDDIGYYRNVYSAASVFAVAGEILLKDASIVYPICDRVIGAAVRFNAGKVTIGQDASFNADGYGYGGMQFTGELDKDYSGVNNISGDARSLCFTYSRGSAGLGYQYSSGAAAYGSDLNNASLGANEPSYSPSGRAYGLACAPYLPGGPGRKTVGSWYSQPANRGGGTVWIECLGQFTLNGTLTADGSATGSIGHSSGGGIWILSRNFIADCNAVMSAAGGSSPGVSSTVGGGGGRIALVLGASEEEKDALARGEIPSSLTVENEIHWCNVDVSGGMGRYVSGTNPYRSADGSVRLLRGAGQGRRVEISGSPAHYQQDGLLYGTLAVASDDELLFNINGDYGVDRKDLNARYLFAGWSVTNGVNQIIAGDASKTAAFVPGADVTYLTWLWGNGQKKFNITLNGGGSFEFDGITYGETTGLYGNGETCVITAKPYSGYEFLYWYGDIPAEMAASQSLTLDSSTARNLMPVFRPVSGARVHTWKSPFGDWHNPENWDSATIPGLEDTVVITGGVCIVSNYAKMATLKMSGNSRLYAGCRITAANAAKSLSSLMTGSTYLMPYENSLVEEVRIDVDGDVVLGDTAQLSVGAQDQLCYTTLNVKSITLRNSARLAIVAGPTNGVYSTKHTHQTGSGFLNVAGSLKILDTTALHPVCDSYTGGGVVIKADYVQVTTNATIDANGLGYVNKIDRKPQSTAPYSGNSYTIGCGHGGNGGGYNASYGKAYDVPYSPVMPGSTAVNPYASKVDNTTSGGGVIRVHARRVKIDGLVTAREKTPSPIYSGGAGGSIWITASISLKISAGAKFDLRGGSENNNYGHGGAGGRMSISRGLSDAEVAAMLLNGNVAPVRYGARPIFDLPINDFNVEYPGVVVDIDGRKGGGNGTFRFLDGGQKRGFMIYLR